jgi:cytochrome c biogenesis protein CcmG/thiol:disulfide interchange protein DsbE
VKSCDQVFEVVKVSPVKSQPRKNTRLVLMILFVCIACVFLIFLLRHERDSTSRTTKLIQPGLEVPNFAFPDINGKQISLSDHRGKVVLVNVWATWCPPCRQEMPSMQRLYEKFKGDNFEILAVSIDSEGREAVAPFMQKMHLTFPALLDPGETIRPLYGITGVPESFIIDKRGILLEKIVGPMNWATPEVFSLFKDLIQKPSS